MLQYTLLPVQKPGTTSLLCSRLRSDHARGHPKTPPATSPAVAAAVAQPCTKAFIPARLPSWLRSAPTHIPGRHRASQGHGSLPRAGVCWEQQWPLHP